MFKDFTKQIKETIMLFIVVTLLLSGVSFAAVYAFVKALSKKGKK